MVAWRIKMFTNTILNFFLAYILKPLKTKKLYV